MSPAPPEPETHAPQGDQAPPSADAQPPAGTQAPPPPQYAPPQYAQPPQAPQYAAPQQNGVPPQAPQYPQQPGQGAGYGAPQPPAYGAQQPYGQPTYGAPQQPAYGAPQQPGSGAPQQPYGAPQQPTYGAQPQYGAQQQYAAPHQQQPYQTPYAAPQFPPAIGVAPGPGGLYDGASNPDDMSRPLYGASFGQAVKRFFRGYAKFSGRASRSEYWWIALFSFLVQLVPMVLLVIGIIGVIASTAFSYDYYSSSYNAGPAAGSIALIIIGGILAFLISLAMLIPSLAVGWRRMHDANFAGPLYLLTFASIIPYVGWLGSIAVLVLALMPSKAEGRRFDFS